MEFLAGCSLADMLIYSGTITYYEKSYGLCATQFSIVIIFKI